MFSKDLDIDWADDPNPVGRWTRWHLSGRMHPIPPFGHIGPYFETLGLGAWTIITQRTRILPEDVWS